MMMGLTDISLLHGRGCSCPISAPHHHGLPILLPSFSGTIHCYHHVVNDWTWLAPPLLCYQRKPEKTQASWASSIWTWAGSLNPSSAISTLDLSWLFLVVTHSLS